mmetsp:Transcript_40982/g.63089  ORF Transcript_40982/g.63089 Transcript_40982/m.63089 type:complete len:575 (+) Transcript_40982:23-1747(+)
MYLASQCEMLQPKEFRRESTYFQSTVSNSKHEGQGCQHSSSEEGQGGGCHRGGGTESRRTGGGRLGVGDSGAGLDDDGAELARVVDLSAGVLAAVLVHHEDVVQATLLKSDLLGGDRDERRAGAAGGGLGAGGGVGVLHAPGVGLELLHVGRRGGGHEHGLITGGLGGGGLVKAVEGLGGAGGADIQELLRVQEGGRHIDVLGASGKLEGTAAEALRAESTEAEVRGVGRGGVVGEGVVDGDLESDVVVALDVDVDGTRGGGGGGGGRGDVLGVGEHGVKLAGLHGDVQGVAGEAERSGDLGADAVAHAVGGGVIDGGEAVGLDHKVDALVVGGVVVPVGADVAEGLLRGVRLAGAGGGALGAVVGDLGADGEVHREDGDHDLTVAGHGAGHHIGDNGVETVGHHGGARVGGGAHILGHDVDDGGRGVGVRGPDGQLGVGERGGAEATLHEGRGILTVVHEADVGDHTRGDGAAEGELGHGVVDGADDRGTGTGAELHLDAVGVAGDNVEARGALAGERELGHTRGVELEVVGALTLVDEGAHERGRARRGVDLAVVHVDVSHVGLDRMEEADS